VGRRRPGDQRSEEATAVSHPVRLSIPRSGAERQVLCYSNGGKPPTQYDPPNYVNASADTRINLADKLSNPAKRFADYAKVLRIYACELPVVSLFTVRPSPAISNKFSFPTFSGYTSTDGPFVMRIRAK
jgi:hypothetical protein